MTTAEPEGRSKRNRMSDFRTEKDTMGDVQVPSWAYWGASSQRAVDNFPVSGIRFPRRFIRALAMIKGAAAEVNRDLGMLDGTLADAISKAAEDVAGGAFDEHFPLDIFQTGSGTSTNTNANEVIANIANERSGSKLGAKSPVHPNNHVNMGQSSNDVIPTTIHVAALDAIVADLLPALETLQRSLAAKAIQFADVVKPARTHLMDAVPITLGQEFSGYARQIELGIERVKAAMPRLGEVALGGTAAGTGINAHPEFAPRVIAKVVDRTGLPLKEAANHFEAQGAQDACVEMSGMLKTVAVSLFKIANDIRWMGSGPDAGLAEISLPDLQPGSSIMPGKVNPVIPEVCTQVAAQVIGNDAAITFGGATGFLDLNVMLPVIARNLLESIGLLASASRLLATKCVDGITTDAARNRAVLESTSQIVTALNPVVGYDKGAELVKEAKRTGKTVRELIVEKGILEPEELDKVLDLKKLTEGGIAEGGDGG